MDEPALKAKTPEGHAIAAARVSALGGTELRLDAPGGGSAQVLDGIQIRTKLKLNSAPETTLAKSSKISQFFENFSEDFWNACARKKNSGTLLDPENYLR